MERREFFGAAGAAVAASLGGLLLPGTAQAADDARKFTIGHTSKDRPINAFLIGDRQARNKYVVLGQMHGDEPAGRMVARYRLVNKPPIEDVAFWVIPTMNPDGHLRGTRVNARGVDLNRNFPSKTWVRRGKGTRYWSGPRPASEPETRALVRFLSNVRPQTVVSIHQPLRAVDFSGGDRRVTYWLAKNLNLPVADIAVSGGGTMTSWFNAEFRRRTAVTVELPPNTTLRYRMRVAEVLVRHAEVRRDSQWTSTLRPRIASPKQPVMAALRKRRKRVCPS